MCLTSKKVIITVDIKDVQSLRPDLSEAKALNVLLAFENRHTADVVKQELESLCQQQEKDQLAA